jgi:serine/threonine protein kinase
VKIHASLRHQYVVRFHHFFEDEEAYYMLLELAHNKSFSELMKKRKKLTQPEVQYYMWQILDALMYLHGIGVIHRDLKLGNLLLDKVNCGLSLSSSFSLALILFARLRLCTFQMITVPLTIPAVHLICSLF